MVVSLRSTRAGSISIPSTSCTSRRAERRSNLAFVKREGQRLLRFARNDRAGCYCEEPFDSATLRSGQAPRRSNLCPSKLLHRTTTASSPATRLPVAAALPHPGSARDTLSESPYYAVRSLVLAVATLREIRRILW